jgi:hypothetical protein
MLYNGIGVVNSRGMEKVYRCFNIGVMVVILVLYTQFAYATGVRISWQENTESNVAGYKVYYGNASRNYDNVIDVGDVTAVEIGDLENTTYYFAITAYDDAGGESDYSEEIVATLAPNGQGTVLSGGDTPGAVSSSGGGGGGCFLTVSSPGNAVSQNTPFYRLIALIFAGIAGSCRKYFGLLPSLDISKKIF